MSSNNCCLNFTTWMTMFSLSPSKLIFFPSSPSHLKDINTTPILLLPTIIFMFLLPVRTKPDFQVLKQKERNCIININSHYTEPSDFFLYLYRFFFLFTWHFSMPLYFYHSILRYVSVLKLTCRFSFWGRIFSSIHIKPDIWDATTLTLPFGYYDY